MSSYAATITLGTVSNGLIILTPGFQATSLQVKLSSTTTGENLARLSIGYGDGTRQSCDSLFADGTVFFAEKFTDRIISLWDNVGGTATEIIKASNPVFTATQVKLDVQAVNTAYKASFLAIA